METILSGFIIDIGKIAVSYTAKLVFLFFHIFKIRQTRIIFTSLTGKNNMAYSCNLKYIFEYISEKSAEKYEIIWAFAKPEDYLFLQKQNVKVVKHFSLKAFFYLMTSNAVITNGAYVSWVPFRKEQLIINTWHGSGAYKRLDIGTGCRKKAVNRRHLDAGRNTTLFLSGCRAFSHYVIRGAFHFQGPILEIGMPRNDILIGNKKNNIAEKVRNKYELKKEVKILLYAPTYRDSGDYKHLNTQHIIQFLEEKTNEIWVCLFRFHHLEGETSEQENTQVRNAGTYPDMQELLIAADILITDYSSSIWDYSFLEKPCYLYVPDLKNYQKMRGFYTDIDDWCIPYAEDEETLFKLLAQIKEINWGENAQKHHNNLGACETGHAAEIIVNYIETYFNNCNLHIFDNYLSKTRGGEL